MMEYLDCSKVDFKVWCVDVKFNFDYVVLQDLCFGIWLIDNNVMMINFMFSYNWVVIMQIWQQGWDINYVVCLNDL